jgi:hypothetical protein
VRSGKSVTNQATTTPDNAGLSQHDLDSVTVLNCIDAIQQDPIR